MDTLQINEYMSAYKNYLGTYPCDKLDFPLYKNSGIIINTDKSSEPGEHWVAIYFSDYAIYFDSFGLQPMNEEIVNYLDLISPVGWFHNTITFQSIYQDTCGMHCIYFLLTMFKYKDFNKYIELMNKNTHSNDILLKILYKSTS